MAAKLHLCLNLRNRKKSLNQIGCKFNTGGFLSLTGSQQTIEEQIKEAIETTVADSTVEVGGDGRHFEIKVISPVFEGKRTLEKQRIVYVALNELMAGSNAPVHAIARLETLVPK